MAKYSSHQRMMLNDSANTARSAANSARSAKNAEASLDALAQSALSQQYATAAMLRIQDDIAAAEATNNRIQLERLRTEQQHLRIQQEEQERSRAEEAKRDRQAFAMWRQTPDGQAFVEWYGPAKSLVDEIYGNDKAWREEVDAVKQEWRSARRDKVAFATHDPGPEHAKTAKSLFIGAGVCALIWMICLAAGVIGLINGLFILGALAFAGAGVWRTVTSDMPQRRAALHELTTQGRAELCFDPMSDTEIPSWGVGDPTSYANRIERFYLSAVTEHPAAVALPQLTGYAFVDPSTLTSGRLRNFLPA